MYAEAANKIKRFLITSDLHLTDNPRDEYRWEIIDYLQQCIDNYQIGHLFVLGDVTDKKDEHTAKLVNRIVSAFARLGTSCPVTILQGNHDYVDPESPFFGFLSNIQNVTFVKQPRPFHLNVGGLDVSFILLPHSNNPMADWRGVNFANVDVVLMHQTVYGAVASNGQEMAGIPATIFKKQGCRLVVSGDIHVPQQVGDVNYVGSPYPVRFGDSYQGRILMFDKQMFEIGGINIFPNILRKVVLEITPQDDLEDLLDEHCETGDHVKIVIAMQPEETDEYSNFRARAVSACERRGLFVASLAGKVDRPVEEITPITTESQAKSDQEIYDEYTKNEELVPAATSIGRKIMEKVRGLRSN